MRKARARGYLELVGKSWGTAISGPVLALLGLALLVVQSTMGEGPRVQGIVKILSWITLAAAVLLIPKAQYDVWKAERERAETAEDRLIPKAIIRNLTPRVWPPGQGGVSVTGKEYYFDIFNLSEADSLENVRVELLRMVPDAIGYPNPPLHLRNDDTYKVTEFEINPGAERQIDLVTGPVDAPNSQQELIIPHTVNKYRTAIPFGRYELTVRVSARNSPPITKTFVVLIDNTGELQCVMQSA